MAFANPQSQRASSSSSSFSIRGWNYDTRHNFTDHLDRTLNQKGIRTFRDDEELPRGEEIAAELLKAIEESRICLIILSECLEELTKIMDCGEQMGKLVFPIFYHVEQIRSFGEALADHERNAVREEGKEEDREVEGSADHGGGYHRMVVKESVNITFFWYPSIH